MFELFVISFCCLLLSIVSPCLSICCMPLPASVTPEIILTGHCVKSQNGLNLIISFCYEFGILFDRDSAAPNPKYLANRTCEMGNMAPQMLAFEP